MSNNDIFTDTFGNTYYRLDQCDGYYKYRILYPNTYHTFVGCLTEKLQPLKGVFHTNDRHIEGIWNSNTLHQPIPNPNTEYKMTFSFGGDDVTYIGKITAELLMHGEGDLHFLSAGIHYKGRWRKDLPARKMFDVYHGEENNIVYKGYIDEHYDLHGHGTQFFPVHHLFESMETIFYHGIPLYGRKTHLVFRNGDVYTGTVNEHRLPDGKGKLKSFTENKTYIGKWTNGENDYIKYRVHPNIIYRSRIDQKHREYPEGTYQILSTGACFPSSGVPKINALNMLASVSTEI